MAQIHILATLARSYLKRSLLDYSLQVENWLNLINKGLHLFLTTQGPFVFQIFHLPVPLRLILKKMRVYILEVHIIRMAQAKRHGT